MSSPAAGACVLVVLGAGVLAVVFAVSPTAGVLTTWAVGAAALARAARESGSEPRRGYVHPASSAGGGERIMIRRLFGTLANDVYCTICGWWYPPHNH
jgi:hypothetical protein